jgi:hypothetical protein
LIANLLNVKTNKCNVLRYHEKIKPIQLIDKNSLF